MTLARVPRLSGPLLTNGAPLAGRGINPQLLGTVTRTDILANTPGPTSHVWRISCLPFFLNSAPGETHGANLFDPFTNLPGVWYLQSPVAELPDPGVATLSTKLCQSHQVATQQSC
jgi:hypothetical protein